ncbi:MAG: O-antigen ligase family protein [Elusimicrobiota bacterium]
MGKKKRKREKEKQEAVVEQEETADAGSFSNKAIIWWLPFLYLLISDSFYLRTYDSAQVKITLVQMGGICLLSLWFCRLLAEGKRAFTKTDLVTLAPFLAYFAYGIFSYLHAPYQFSSLDAFLRRIFYMTVPLILIREFNLKASERFTRILIWTTWITVGYGFLQWFDITFFPPGVGMGPDPFIWRQAFGKRVFSTFGNPNFFADFLVIMFPILVCQYAKTKDLKLVPLIGLLLWDLIATETKGAWVGMVISASLLSGTYIYFFNRDILRRYALHLAGAFLIAVAVVGGGIVHKLNNSSWTSVNFRLFTWEATWEMVMTQPLIGTGIGSFWVIYPAFRRPPIFHIEGKHNTETDHSENEWLEVLYDEGILGFGIFVWLIFTACFIAYRCLGQLTGSLKKGQRAPPRAWDILGYLIAFQGMLAHNLFDVSMRFVSSGIYLGLLSGMVVNLCRGQSLAELHQQQPDEAEPEGSVWDSISSFLIWPARLAAWAGIAYLLFVFIAYTGTGDTIEFASSKGFQWFEPRMSFHALQGEFHRMRLGGEKLQWAIAWAAFLFCVLSQGYIFARVTYLAKNALIPIVIVLMIFPLRLTWGFFRADVHHNIAIFFSKQKDWEKALENYLIVGKLNPAFVMSFYFKGNVFNDRFDMTKKYVERWGDTDNRARDDYDRALDAYDEVRSKAPNYVQMHHQVGVLHLKRGQWERSQAQQSRDQAKALQGQGKTADAQALLAKAAGHAKDAEVYLDKALERMQLYRAHDPVFAPNYFRMGQIYMMRQQYDKAVETYQALIEADQCRVVKPLSDKKLLRDSILKYQWYFEVDEGGGKRWKHEHRDTDAYTHLGNALYLQDRLRESVAVYQKALNMQPDNEHARNNLRVVLQKARKLGRLKINGPNQFEITPAK